MTMPHMIPQYEHTTKWLLERPNGESELLHDIHDATDDILGDTEIGNGESYTITRQHGWFARLSAPGYLDCTDWAGPFSTEEEARDHIADTYEVDPDTGDELEGDAVLCFAPHAAAATQEETT